MAPADDDRRLRASRTSDLRELVERAAEQRPDAWEALYRRSYRTLFGFARRRLFDDRAAEDAVSETMTRALDGIERFTWQGGGFDAWLYGIARNVVHELTRHPPAHVALVHEDRPARPSAARRTHAVAGAEIGGHARGVRAAATPTTARCSSCGSRAASAPRRSGGCSASNRARCAWPRPGRCNDCGRSSRRCTVD